MTQRPQAYPASMNGRDRSKVLSQSDYSLGQLIKGSAGVGRFNHGKKRFFLLAHVSLGQVVVELIKETAMLPFQIIQEVFYSFDEQADPTEMAHIGLNMNRIHTLPF